ncbi:hypothetical protein [Siminovitchia fordii]|uniref:Lipoprotein YdeJ n=1 Tax=Siminovitchia fordii TaxID=254759 RepID=A0ABQ4K7C0_9BACI|nr:hypothetical protein [Siminovitchia fordii]GIN21638.1 putative lipoprotein YdeJ [Siminovitchia fordii]
MKKLINIFYCSVALFVFVPLLVGCSDGKNEESKTVPSENVSVSKSEKELDDMEEGNLTDKKIDESESTHTYNIEEEDALSEYSSQEIEYARVWLQLGPNQEVDELNVSYIPAGEPINPDDDTSASYPEDVIQLAGSRLVDGAVTYSGNGDGTINVYNVPLRWESPADVDNDFMKEYTEGILENTELVSIEPGDNEKIVELIGMLNVHY